jgi:transcriptional regulator with XRE-family HTH domain
LIVDNIRNLCKKRGITLWALEKATGIGNGVIARWENSSPRVENLKLVADYFGVSIDDLLKEGKTNE